MIEQVFKIASGNSKVVEKVIQDENVHYMHMIFNKDEGAPEHFSNSNVYMTVVRGKLSIALLSVVKPNAFKGATILVSVSVLKYKIAFLKRS